MAGGERRRAHRNRRAPLVGAGVARAHRPRGRRPRSGWCRSARPSSTGRTSRPAPTRSSPPRCATRRARAPARRCSPRSPSVAATGTAPMLPGQLSLSPELLAAVLREYARWAASSGLTRLLFVNAHFGNVGALLGGDRRAAAAASRAARRHRELVGARSGRWPREMTRRRRRRAREPGRDVVDAAHRARSRAPRPARATPTTPTAPTSLVFRYTAPVLSTNGVTGRPSEATPELGAKLFDLTVDALVDRVERGRVEEPPLGSRLPSRRPDPSN